MGKRDDATNYVTWFFVIAVAVTVGNLASTWIVATLADYALRREIAQLSEEAEAQSRRARAASAAQARQAAARNSARREAMIEKRRADRTGRKLARSCEEWLRAHADLNTQTTRSESRSQCARYQHYVKSGNLLPEK